MEVHGRINLRRRTRRGERARSVPSGPLPVPRRKRRALLSFPAPSGAARKPRPSLRQYDMSRLAALALSHPQRAGIWVEVIDRRCGEFIAATRRISAPVTSAQHRPDKHWSAAALRHPRDTAAVPRPPPGRLERSAMHHHRAFAFTVRVAFRAPSRPSKPAAGRAAAACPGLWSAAQGLGGSPTLLRSRARPASQRSSDATH